MSDGRLTDRQIEHLTGKKAAQLEMVLHDGAIWHKAAERGWWETYPATPEPAEPPREAAQGLLEV